MAEIKATPMLLKVDLQCPRCYKKIKNLLCRYYEIQDQVFDEKQNTVKITVFCCNPEKIRQKLIYKGGKTIKSIEIIKPPPKKDGPPPEKPTSEPEKPKSKPPAAAADPKTDKPAAQKPPEKPTAPPKEVPVLVPVAPKPASSEKPASQPKEAPPPAKPADPAPKPKEASPPPANPASPAVMAATGYPRSDYPVGFFYPLYYSGYNQEVPCYPGGYGMPPSYYESYGRPPACPCGCGARGYCSNCCDYFTEGNPSTCSIM